MISGFNPHFDESEDWDFKGANTKYLTHGLHPYPAKMIPQIAERLLKRYATSGDLVLDPFSGSGGVLVEARLANMNSIGIDLNPLACLISEVKSNPIKHEKLCYHQKQIEKEIKDNISKFKKNQLIVDPPDFYEENILYWFKEETIKELTLLRNIIKRIEDRDIRRFFDLILSRTVREVSGTRKREFKLYRMKAEKWLTYQPDTFNIFFEYFHYTIERMNQFSQKSPKNVFSKVYLANSMDIFTDQFPIEGNQIMEDTPPKIIVTSPPYGDHQTTVAYGQFSRYSSLWLDYEDEFYKDVIWSVDREGLGGKKRPVPEMDYYFLSKTVDDIKEKDIKRGNQALVFFHDWYKCLIKMYELLDTNGHACIVVANRTMKRVPIPFHLITAELAVDIGFDENVTFYPRDIPSKRLPWKNAPENITGLGGKTMSKENIVVLKKS